METFQSSLNRCPWCLGFPDYITYHDTEWGVPVHDDQIHFEFLVLEKEVTNRYLKYSVFVFTRRILYIINVS